jgi:Tat protein secretion system quality control protein TatD with DNase activity
VFIYLFDIAEYYKQSDFLLEKIFKILTNIITAKNENIQDMVRYLLEDTPLIPFLMNNRPQLVEQMQEVVSEAKSEAEKQTEISDNDG